MNLKQKLLSEKSQKLRVAARRFLKDEGGVTRVFAKESCKPTEQQFEEICVAAKYGPGDPLFAGGKTFAIGHLIGNLNAALTGLISESNEKTYESERFFDHDGQIKISEDGFESPTVITAEAFQFCEPQEWGNLLIQCVVNSALIGNIEKIDPNEYEFEESRGIYVNKDTRQIGFRVYVETLLPIKDYPAYPEEGYGRKSGWLKSNEFFSLYTIQLGFAQDFDSLHEAELHGVQGHSRQLSSGKVVPVRPHERHNPTRGMSRKLNTDEVSHLVYRAYDMDGVLRYIGEGKENRPQHVNSGTSHNFKLNEHFFLRGPMRVEIVQTGLSKEESLAIEYLLIKKNTGGTLWNIKDNDSPPA
jgi:hypothetical protein